jgi:2-(1,2-epoxy-1,2-dihydrophenyl)acetyl-CoA isomerase
MTEQTVSDADVTEEAAALYEVVDGVAWLTLNRPDKLNALNLEMVGLLRDYLHQAQQDPDVKVVVVTGAGRGFCSGADLKGLFGSGGAGTNVNAVPQHSQVQLFTADLYYLDKPVIAAINGPAVGAGFELSLACDIRMVAESGYFMEAAMRHGLIPGDGSVLLLPRLIGAGRAFDILLTGDKVLPDEALAIGLAREVVPDADFRARVQAYAERLAKPPADATAMLKQAMRYSAPGPELRSVFNFLRLGVTAGKTLRRAEGSFPSGS